MTESTTTQDCNCDEQDNACSIVHVHSPVTHINICSDGCCDGGNGSNEGEQDNEGTQDNPGGTPSNPSNPSDGTGKLIGLEPAPLNERRAIRGMTHSAQGGLIAHGYRQDLTTGTAVTSEELYSYSPDFSTGKRFDLPKSLTGSAIMDNHTYLCVGGSTLLKMDENFDQVEHRTVENAIAEPLFGFNGLVYGWGQNELFEIGPDFRVTRAFSYDTMAGNSKAKQVITTDTAIYLYDDKWIQRLDENLQPTAALEFSNDDQATLENVALGANEQLWFLAEASDGIHLIRVDGALDERKLFELSLPSQAYAKAVHMVSDTAGQLTITANFATAAQSWFSAIITLDTSGEDPVVTDVFTIAEQPNIRAMHRTPDDNIWFATGRSDLRRGLIFNKGYLTADSTAFLRGPLAVEDILIGSSSLAMEPKTHGTATAVSDTRTIDQEKLDITVTDVDMSGVLSA